MICFHSLLTNSINIPTIKSHCADTVAPIPDVTAVSAIAANNNDANTFYFSFLAVPFTSFIVVKILLSNNFGTLRFIGLVQKLYS